MKMARIRYEVDMVRQQWSPVCWLACATMLIQFKRRQTPAAGFLGLQDHHDFRVPQTIPAFTGEEWQRMRQLGLINSRSSRLPVWLGSLDQQLIFDQLKQHGPFILHHYCGSFWYGANRTTPTTGAHSVLVVGTDTDRGCVWFHNPWGDSNVPTTTTSILGAINRFERNPADTPISWM